MANVTDVIGALPPVLTDLAANAMLIEKLAGPDKQEARLTAQMEQAGFGPTGQYRHAPRAAKMEAWDRYKAEDDARLSDVAADLQDELEQLWRVMPAVEESTMEAPTVLQVIKQRHPSYDTAPVSFLQAELVDVTLEQVLTPKVAAMTPVVALRTYQAALADPTAPRHAATIRMIESKIGAGGFGPDPSDDAAAEHLMQLARLVQDTRQARVPAELRTWRDAVGKAQKARGLVQAAGIKRVSRGEIPALAALVKAAQG